MGRLEELMWSFSYYLCCGCCCSYVQKKVLES